MNAYSSEGRSRSLNTIIVNKDNHLRDCLKYVVLSRPAPAEVPTEIKRQQIINGSFEDGTYGTLGVHMAQ